MTKRKICVVIAGRANYGRARSILNAIQQSDQLELQIVAGGSALIERFGKVAQIIENDGFSINASCNYIIDGGTPQTMAASTGLAIIELSSAFERLQPDMVVTIADRYETLATAVAASYMNIPLAHTQGGEVTGSIDESVRHAITKLAHIHFPATELSRQRIIQMGENPEFVFNIGCPAIDEIADLDLSIDDEVRTFVKTKGVGSEIDFEKDYLVFMQHPVTNEFLSVDSQINSSIQLLESIDMQKLILWPNIDAGTDNFSKNIRKARENNTIKNARYFINFPIELYAKIIFNSKMMIGNSSSAIREGAFLGVPAMNIGNRQWKRERANNIIDVNYDVNEMKDAYSRLLKMEKLQKNTLYGKGDAGLQIAKILETVALNVNKEFFDID